METMSSTFSRGLEKAAQRLDRSKRELDHTRVLLSDGDMESAYASALLLAQEVEQLALLTRALPAHTGHPLAAIAIEEMLLSTVPIKIGFTPEGWFGLSIPALLPKKSKGGTDYIRAMLYPAMRKFFTGKEPVCYPNCVLIFRHVYDSTRPERAYRDHDNIEINMVADIVALYVMKDDAPLRCAHYYCSASGNHDRTEVFVVNKSEFPAWLETSMCCLGEEVELLEDYP